MWHWEQMLLTALSRCRVPEAIQELGFLPAWQELGGAAHDLSTARAPVLPFVCWEFGMEVVALGVHRGSLLGVQLGRSSPGCSPPVVPELSGPA